MRGRKPCRQYPSPASEAQRLGVEVVWDSDCHTSRLAEVAHQIDAFIERCDAIYLTLDLDVLPGWQMPGVSAPAAYGLPIENLLPLLKGVCRHDRLRAVDLVEYNPQFDTQQLGARVAGRIIWQLLHDWQHKALGSSASR